jgi:glycosyltransferase involved in cell wall biosynthesis
MRIAAHGLITDAGGSGAGAFSLLLRALLEQGHDVTFYGIPRFTEPKSLTSFERYRFVPMRIPAMRHLMVNANRFPTRYPASIASTVSHVAYQRRAIRLMEAEPKERAPDFVLCLDALNLWRSRLPVLSWPQSPPQTEWQALSAPRTALSVARTAGPLYLGAVNAFYAYRYVQARLTMGASDSLLISSRWSRDLWLRFGLREERADLIPYPLDLDGLASVPLRATGEQTTFLWLGRAVPRKRLDLFLGAFARLQQRVPGVRALLVGNLTADPVAARLLERHRATPGITVLPPVPRAEVGSIFAQADVVVQPSENENFGFAVAEGLAAGRAVVCGPTNGTRDYPGGAGFWFERYDVEAVAQAMDRARLAIECDRARLAELARSSARRHFGATQVVDRLIEIAGSVIARRREQRPS